MKNNAFTLVELLAVIVILSLLALLASTAVTKLVKDSKDDLSSSQITFIKSSAKTWIAGNLNKLPEVGSCAYLTLEDLKEYGLLDDEVMDSKNNKKISDELKIKITTTTNGFGNPNRKVEVNPESIEGCSYIYLCKPVSQKKATKLADGTTPIGRVPEGTYQKGDEYICNVDGTNSYRFFILSGNIGNEVTTDLTKEGITSYNLIMHANINEAGEAVDGTQTQGSGNVAWVSQEDYENALGTGNYNTDGNNKGPITAMKSLALATSNWTKLNPLTFTYDEEEENVGTDGYDKIEFNNGITSIYSKDSIGVMTLKDGETNAKLRTRLPKKSELTTAGCLTTDGSCPPWLTNYLCYNTVNQVIGVCGYWTLSSENVARAWFVSPERKIYENAISEQRGVRPVITVSKSDLS